MKTVRDLGIGRRSSRDTDDPTPICGWFVHCFRPAAGLIKHPILGPLPCCQRCTDRLEMGDQLQPF